MSWQNKKSLMASSKGQIFKGFPLQRNKISGIPLAAACVYTIGFLSLLSLRYSQLAREIFSWPADNRNSSLLQKR